MRIIKRFIY